MPDTLLICHPISLCPHVARFGVSVAAQPDGGLTFAYRLTGDISALLIPAQSRPDRKDELWRHTCCEVFISTGSGPAYREFNFSPSGAWAAYDFDGYRTGMTPAPMTPPKLTCRNSGNVLELTALLPADALPAGARLHLAISAVIEDKHGNISYWALRHPADQPDFHHTGGFALDLDLA